MSEVDNVEGGGRIGPADDRVRVLRVIEYEGPRQWVETTLRNSISGTKTFPTPYGQARITGATVNDFPEVLVRARTQVWEKPE